MSEDKQVQEFITILRQHEKIIFKVAASYCDDSEARKDLYQEILMQWWRAFPTFRAEAKISTWLYRIALNTAISSFRKTQHQRQNVVTTELPADIQSTQNTAFQNEQVQQLHRAIAQLNDIEKAIILLYLDEYQYDEIALVVGITANNVGVRITRIKDKLKKWLNG